MAKRERVNIYELMAKGSFQYNIQYKWREHPEQALEYALKQPKVIAMIGEWNLDSTLTEIVEWLKAYEYANKSIAEREKEADNVEKHRSQTLETYNKRIESFKNSREDSVEYQAGIAYELKSVGIKMKIRQFANVLVQKGKPTYDFNRRIIVYKYAIQSTVWLDHQLKVIIEGFVLSRKIIELENKVSFIELVNKETDNKLQVQGIPEPPNSVVKSTYIANNGNLPTSTLAEIENLANIVDHVPIKSVYQHFRKYLVDRGFLSEQDLCLYIKLAFIEGKKPINGKLSLNYGNKKSLIGAVYYAYFDKIASRAKLADTYLNLLCEYFIGFEPTNVYKNWSTHFDTYLKKDFKV